MTILKGGLCTYNMIYRAQNYNTIAKEDANGNDYIYLRDLTNCQDKYPEGHRVTMAGSHIKFA